MNSDIAARLAELHIELMAEAKAYCVFAREGCMALAQRSEAGGFSSVGSSGILTDHGLAYLLWKDGRPVFAAHGGHESPADEAGVRTVQQFSRDLKAALGIDE